MMRLNLAPSFNLANHDMHIPLSAISPTVYPRHPDTQARKRRRRKAPDSIAQRAAGAAAQVRRT